MQLRQINVKDTLPTFFDGTSVGDSDGCEQQSKGPRNNTKSAHMT